MSKVRSVRNCNVAVVGGAGFLGSHLVDHLIEDRGCTVLVVDNLEAGCREFVHKKAHFRHADITKSESYLRGLFEGFGIKFVFNYSANPYVPDSFARPNKVADVNLMGALQVINAAQEAGCEGILQVSSAEIYGDGDTGKGVTGDSWAGKSEDGTVCGFKKLNENSPVRPHSSYGASKSAVDFAVQAAWRERKTPCIALRQFNCCGERETHDYVVPTIISQIAKQRAAKDAVEFMAAGGSLGPGMQSKVAVHLGNNSFRDLMYAGDAVKIAVELLECGEFGECYNLGSETGIKIYDLAKLIGKLMGFADVEVVPDTSRMRPWEIWHLQSDNTKINAAIGVGSESHSRNQAMTLTPLEEALKRTISYFQENGNRWCWE